LTSRFLCKRIRIAAGCFFGAENEFNRAVDEKYHENAIEAKAYKSLGHECVAALKLKSVHTA